MIRIAHRGVPTRVIENTLRSIQLAESSGADATEFDVRATRDGVAVLLHDRTLQRFWGDPRAVSDVTLSEVKALGARSPDGVVDRIPTFEETLDGTRALLVVDIKDASVVAAIGELVRTRGQMARVRFIGEPPILEVVRATIAGAQIIMSWSAPELPPADLLARIGPFAINLKWSEDNGAAAPRFAARGYELWSYTIDDAATARQARMAGITGIISNDLGAIATGLAAS